MKGYYINGIRNAFIVGYFCEDEDRLIVNTIFIAKSMAEHEIEILKRTNNTYKRYKIKEIEIDETLL